MYAYFAPFLDFLYFKKKEADKETCSPQNFKVRSRDSFPLIYHFVFEFLNENCALHCCCHHYCRYCCRCRHQSHIVDATIHQKSWYSNPVSNTQYMHSHKKQKIRENHEWDFCYDVTAHFFYGILLDLTKYVSNLRFTFQPSSSIYRTLSHFFFDTIAMAYITQQPRTSLLRLLRKHSIINRTQFGLMSHNICATKKERIWHKHRANGVWITAWKRIQILVLLLADVDACKH